MARYRLTNVADRKIESIYEYSVLNFGEARADSYFLALHDMFELLADNPSLGREEPELGEGIRRFLHQSHVVFYRATPDGVLILDLFGARQRPPSAISQNDQ